MKRFTLPASILVVFIVLLTACSENTNQTDIGKGRSFASEQVEASQSKSEPFLSKSSEETIDNSEAKDLQQLESNAAAQDLGVLQEGKYINTKLGFSLNIPEHWMEHLVIESGYVKEEAIHSIDFHYVANGDVKQFLFSIMVYNRTMDESQWQNPLLTYMGTSNGKTYVHVIAGEPSETILEEKNKEHFEFVQQLINEELLEVLGTFQYIDY